MPRLIKVHKNDKETAIQLRINRISNGWVVKAGGDSTFYKDRETLIDDLGDELDKAMARIEGESVGEKEKEEVE